MRSRGPAGLQGCSCACWLCAAAPVTVNHSPRLQAWVLKLPGQNCHRHARALQSAAVCQAMQDSQERKQAGQGRSTFTIPAQQADWLTNEIEDLETKPDWDDLRDETRPDQVRLDNRMARQGTSNARKLSAGRSRGTLHKQIISIR